MFLTSDLKKPIGQVLTKWFLLKAGLVEKNTLYCVVLQNGYFSPPFVRGMGGFFFSSLGKPGRALESKSHKNVGPPSSHKRFFSLICPVVCQLQFGFFYPALVSRAFCSWVSAPISCDSLFLPVYLQFGGSVWPNELKPLIEEKLLGCSDDFQSLQTGIWKSFYILL